MTKFVTIALIAIISLLAIAACGSDDAEEIPAPRATATAAPTTAIPTIPPPTATTAATSPPPTETPTPTPPPPTAIPIPTPSLPTTTPAPTPLPPTAIPIPTPPLTTPAENRLDQAEADFLQAVERWEQANMSDYEYVGAWTGFYPEDYLAKTQVTVRDGMVSLVSSATRDVQSIPAPERFLTIEGLFALVQEAIAQNASNVEVTYDETHGYPVDLFIDHDKRMADEETRFTISSFTTPADNSLAQAEADFLQGKERWEQAAMSDYVYTGAWTCFCPEVYLADTQVTVGGGKVTDVSSASPDFESIPAPERFLTIEGLFALIQEAITQGASSIEVIYDETYGYPADLFIDHDERMADEEDSFIISSFTPR